MVVAKQLTDETYNANKRNATTLLLLNNVY